MTKYLGTGVWEVLSITEEGDSVRSVVIFAEGY